MTVISIEIDALSKKHITNKDTPFLYNLKSRSYIADLETNLTFLEYIDAFTGKYPEETGIFSVFYYNKKSIYNWLTPFPFIRYIDNKITKLNIDIITNLIKLLKRENNFISSAKIPIKLLSLINISVKKQVCNLEIPTPFKVLKENNKKYCYINLPVICTEEGNRYTIKTSDEHAVKKAIQIKNKDFYHIYLRGVDNLTHKYGINSKEVKERMNEIDKLIKKLSENFNNPTLIIHSLHGMVPVKNKINILEKIKNKNCIMFLDSTMARFWFKNKESMEDVIRILKRIKHGHILTKKELKKYRINFKDNKYGDLIFLADPGTIITPNYFQGNKTVKAMHGYKPIKQLDGFLLYNNNYTKYKNLKRINITKLYSLFLKSLK